MKGKQEKETMAKRLREAREYLGISQEYVAQETGISRPAISEIESGRRKVDSLELKRFSKLYGRPIEYLLGTSEDDESTVAVGADPLEGKLRAMTRGLTSDDREEILRFVEYLKHRNASNGTGQ
jgi:transcriptional regulator with XRE-family HTH domain